MKRPELALKPDAVLVLLCGLATVAAHFALYERYLPTDAGLMGHDYGAHLPRLLAGYYWFQENGLFAIPWFSPAFCAGLPFYASPANAYISVPQFLTFAGLDPLQAVRGMLALFAALGFAGTYLLLRGVFHVGTWPAVFGAVVFAFNAFYSHNVLLGHEQYHSFMLVPLIGYVLLRPLPEDKRDRRWRWLLDAALAGLAFAYMFQSRNLDGILPAAGALAAIWLIRGLAVGWSWDFAGKMALAAPIAALLGAAKLVALGAFLDRFPRDHYRLPGFDNPLDAVRFVLESLFLRPPHEAAADLFVNRNFAVDIHAFQYGVTPVAGAFLLLGAAYAVTRLIRERRLATVQRHGWTVAALLAVLAVPIALNFYEPDWNAFLKRLPVLKNSNILTRWFSLYVPPAAVLAAVAFDRLPLRKALVLPTAVAAAVLAVAFQWTADRTFYEDQPYRPNLIVEAYREARATGTVPPIRFMGAFRDASGRIELPPNRTDTLVRGISQIFCREPIFGYRMERYELKGIAFGPSNGVAGGHYNTRNPACYLYPEENRCEPGDRFREDQGEAVGAFLTYRPFPFAQPGRQTAANRINLAALMAAVAFLVAYAVRWFWRRRRDQSATT